MKIHKKQPFLIHLTPNAKKLLKKIAKGNSRSLSSMLEWMIICENVRFESDKKLSQTN